MKTFFKILFLFGVLILTFYGCSVKWTKAISYGNLAEENIKENIEIELRNRLIIVPVTIHSKEYRFLYDTGAPFSISNQLQKEINFKIVSNGNIIDSDHNRKKVDWVRVDSIYVDDALFLNQTAFVGDFKSNPILSCLGIDGIVGSNLIRQANWTIDQKQQALSLFSSIEKNDFDNCIAIPFNTDNQYNIFIDVGFGSSKVKNVLVDFGSNGSIALSKEIFAALKEKGVFESTLIEKGVNQSGIIGNPIKLNREITFSDSIRLNSLTLENVLIKTGETVSIGTLLLSRFQVTIDWENKNLYLNNPKKRADRIGLAGFKLGYSPEKGIYIQSVIEESNAYKEGVRTNMKVLKVDSLDFENGNDFCDYVEHNLGNEIYIQLIDSLATKQNFYFKKTY